MLIEPLLRRFVVIGRYQQDSVRAGILGRTAEGCAMIGIVRAGACQNGNPSRHSLRRILDRPDMLLVRHRRCLACRTRYDDTVGSLLNLEI